jgi:hypothetical protein
MKTLALVALLATCLTAWSQPAPQSPPGPALDAAARSQAARELARQLRDR